MQARGIIFCLLFLLSAAPVFGEAPPDVRSGLDVFVGEGLPGLRGKRIGLIVNHTSRASDGRHLADILIDTPGCTVAALFTPEHGFYGALDRPIDRQSDYRGVPVYSLYGKTTRPSSAELAGIDLLIFDIQDIGSRFYTYISTLALCMQSAAEHHIPFLVLDRPNPIGGRVEGNIPEERFLRDFVCYYPIPIRHGMTVGELARLFNEAYGIHCSLELVLAEGWSRSTGAMPWIDPSPNMRSLDAALLYPALACLEGSCSSLSVGRGTDLPYLQFGAPWMDGGKIAAMLQNERIPGLEFSQVSFKPFAERYQGKNCGGVRVEVTDREAFRAMQFLAVLLETLSKEYPEEFRLYPDFDRMAGTSEIRKGKLDRRRALELLQKGWDDFMTIREKYLLYPDKKQ